MTKRQIRDLERQCKKEPDNLVARLLLAAAYREAGRTQDAVSLYRSVASSYQQQGRRTQAVAVLRSLLEIDPQDPDSRALLDQIDRDASGPSVPPPFQPPASATPPPDAATPTPGDRPSTIPSLDAHRPSTTGTAGRPRGARVLADDVVLRELTPVRPPGVPATVRPPSAGARAESTRPEPTRPDDPRQKTPTLPSPASTLSGLGAIGVPRRPPSKPSTSRSSSGLFTPTPLPRPVPFHEVERTADHEKVVADPDDDAKTRIADAFRPRRGEPPPLRSAPPEPRHETQETTETSAPRAATTGERTLPEVDLSQELETRRHRRLSEHELDLLGGPPGHSEPVPRVDAAELHEETNPDAAPHGARAATLDDEPTRLADEQLRPTRPSNEFEGPTDVRGASKARAAAPRPARPAAPARPAVPVMPPLPAIQPPPRTAPRPRPAPIDDDAATRVASPVPAERDTAPHVRAVTPVPEELTDVRTGPAPRISEPGMHRSRAFGEQSFVSTLGEMDPDGAAIDAPLDVFSMLPPDALAELGRRMTLRRYAPGELIVREGEPGDACYVIADGEVRVLKNDPLTPEAGPVEVARLGSRSLFGEFALLADRRRHASVQATTHCDVYEIPRQLLRELAASFPDVGPLLEQFYRQRLLATLLRTAPFFAPLPEEQRTQLLARFVPIRAESGEPIVREGQPAGGLYLIIIGSVEITRRLGKHRSVILATLREGAYFGEMSLLSGEPTSATVVAAGTVELALLPPHDFYEIVAAHPQLWQAIRREARTRALENARLLAGDSGTV